MNDRFGNGPAAVPDPPPGDGPRVDFYGDRLRFVHAEADPDPSAELERINGALSPKLCDQVEIVDCRPYVSSVTVRNARGRVTETCAVCGVASVTLRLLPGKSALSYRMDACAFPKRHFKDSDAFAAWWREAHPGQTIRLLSEYSFKKAQAFVLLYHAAVGKSGADGSASAPERGGKDLEQTRIEELRTLNAIVRPDPDRDPRWRDYWENRFPALPEEIKPAVYYAACRLRPDVGHSGGHFGQNAYAPISFLGYPTEGDGWFGVAFRLNRPCFGRGEVELYYTDCDIERGRLRWNRDPLYAHAPYWDGSWEDLTDRIARYSSGVAGVRVCQRCGGVSFGDPQKPVHYIRFRLDETKLKKSVTLSKKEVPAEAFGGYALVVPRIGEFSCVLGVFDGDTPIPLLCDDYCMK